MLPMKNVGVIGTGVVGDALASGFLKKGWRVMRGTRDPATLEEWRRGAGASASVGTFAEAAKFGEVVVLAVTGTAAEDAVRLCGPQSLARKTVIDAMNPITDAPPQNGLLSFFTAQGESLMERLQRLAPEARFVKAFSCVGSAHMVDPEFGETPTMFICGNDDAAKREVAGILRDFGWASEDMGGVASARAIEPLCILWCLPGFLRNDWAHAIRWLKK